MNNFTKESDKNEDNYFPYKSWKVIKRDGITEVSFEQDKIINAVKKAFKSVNGTDENCDDIAVVIANKTIVLLEKDLNNKSNSIIFSVEEIQDKVEQALIQLGYSKIAKEYIVYREKRNQVRMMNSSLMQTYKDFVTKPISEIDEMRENANIDGQNPMGGILKFGSEASKTFTDLYLIKPLHAKYHSEGYWHVHDKDFYTFRTTTCTQIDIKSLLNRGFHTGHGFLRTPGNIISAAALACIAIQSNQADQHGGQSIPNLDYGLAPYVAKTYIKKVIEIFEIFKRFLSEESLKTVKSYLKKYYEEHNDLLSKTAQDALLEKLCFVSDTGGIEFPDNFQTLYDTYKPYVEMAIERTERDTFQAMEAMVHNFNTLKSRSGGQVPFSSVNFGTDTTEEGRMVSRNFLKAIDAGLGKHETSIFPVAIFQVKRGFNYNKKDPNYDLFELSCEVSSRRLFPESNWGLFVIY
ncbi:MAG: anaerobic ribonucleoside-triphosphate reductase [Faecalibacillus sp.]